MTNGQRALAGVIRTEFRMQWRRRAMWFAMVVTGLFFLVLFWTRFTNVLTRDTPTSAVGLWTAVLNVFLPIAFGVLLIDRLPRDRSLHTNDLLDATPTSLTIRIWGKTIGAGAATIVPFLLIEAAGMLYLAVHMHAPEVLWLGPAAAATITLPALVFVAVTCVMLSGLFSVAVARISFVGFWLWMELPPFRIPSLSGTVVAPQGGYAVLGLFGAHRFPAGYGGLLLPAHLLAPPVSTVTAAISIALIIAMAIAVWTAGPVFIQHRYTA